MAEDKMNDVIDLRKGHTYFYVAYFDPELSIPVIDTYVYEGYDKEDGHLFADAASYLATVAGKGAEDGHYLCFPDGEIHGMLDKEHLIQWLREGHSPRRIGRTYEYQAI